MACGGEWLLMGDIQHSPQPRDSRSATSVMTAASASWRSVEVICDFLLNGEDSAIEVIHDSSKFLLALRFEGGFQVPDFHFVGSNLDFSLGYLGSLIFLICRYVGRLTGREADKSKGRRNTLSEDVRCVVGLSFTNASIRYALNAGIGSEQCALVVDSKRARTLLLRFAYGRDVTARSLSRMITIWDFSCHLFPFDTLRMWSYV